MKHSSVVTMAMVARLAGVATSTVSKALRSDPTISEECREKVQKAAAEMGYRPNPMVSALMARLHSNRRRNDPYHIAWIDLWPDDREAAMATDFNLMLGGARRRAEELGYNIEVHAVGREGTTAARLHQILTARSQWGLIIPPVPRSAMSYALNLEGLTGVTIGTSLHQPVMHRVAANHFQGAQLACRKLRKKGFKRIGIVLTPAIHQRVEGRWVGAFLSERLSWSARDRVKPLLVAEDEKAAFYHWMEAQRPDAILVAEPHVERWLDARPLKKPQPFVAWLRIIPQKRRGVPAVDTGPYQMGAAAVELVVGQIHRNERGSPPFPHTLLMDGVWMEGSA